jgi:hypothetical protein
MTCPHLRYLLMSCTSHAPTRAQPVDWPIALQPFSDLYSAVQGSIRDNQGYTVAVVLTLEQRRDVRQR